ncbi:hypothetical protein OG230_20035 [Streptomyces sp. NBC_00234]|uniref:hypothetical protein n=1 Tax=Streptomyces sp. NBC_00234 TaxID=2903638 RepID=UPI002E2D76D9|nr:hypothetical protein [Streptomyces sp. NBC_00234]
MAALGVERKLTLIGLAIAAVGIAPVLAGPVSAAWKAAFPEDAVVMDAAQENDPCFSDWILRKGNAALESKLKDGDERQFTRWEREGRIVHMKTVAAQITVHGNTDKAVQIRDVTVTVTDRTDPATGKKAVRQHGCGGGDFNVPEAIAVNLDAIAVGRSVSVLRLQDSPRQKGTAKAALPYGEPIQLPKTITEDDFYSFFLIGMTERAHCSWKAEVTWWDGKETRTASIDNDGVPFRVSSGPA